MSSSWLRAVLLCGLVMAPGCGKKSETTPTSPTPTTLNLAGAWTGTMTGIGPDTPVTWTATQSGANVTGPATATQAGIVLSGTMTGTVTSTTATLTLTLTHPTGCAMAATFNPTGPTTARLSGGISFTAGCPAGAGANNGTLTLTK